jgi:hypothetical protein
VIGQGVDDAPDICLTYLPGLDYDLQRLGPSHPRAAQALSEVLAQIGRIATAARERDYQLVVVGDYAIDECPKGAVYPNRVLADAGLLPTRTVRGRAYLDLYESRAFALVDHEIAHVYVCHDGDLAAARRVLEEAPGVGRVLAWPEQVGLGIDHANTGDLVLEAAPGHWFSYRYWDAPEQAPDYAGHVDIHRKPGYDPCELFLGWPPGSVSRDDRRIRGSHGRAGPNRRVACAAGPARIHGATLIELAKEVRSWLNQDL